MINYDLETQPRLESLSFVREEYESGRWGCFNQWLQRFEQRAKWEANDKLKARQYMRRLLMTKGPIQSFFVGHIDFIIEAVNRGKAEKPDLKELWDLMLEWLERSKEGGMTHIIFDSQNRLKFGIQPFFKNKLSVSLTIDGEERNNVHFKDLDDETKQQVLDHEVWISYAYAGSIEAIVEQLVAMNEGEPWVAHERRSTRLSPVALQIYRTTNHHKVRELHCKLAKNAKVFNDKEYSLDKKGDSLFVAELVHYLRYAHKGDHKSLDAMYDESDANLVQELKIGNELAIWVANNIPDCVVDKHFSKEMYRDIFIFTSMLIRATKNIHRADEVRYNVKLRQITHPSLYIEKLINRIQKKIQDASNFPIKKDVVTGDPILDKDGNTIPYKKTPLPDTFAIYHRGSKAKDFRGRERLFINEFNDLIDECVDEGIIQPTDARKMSEYEKLQAKTNFVDDPSERFVSSNIKSVLGLEIDHIQPVKKNGSNDANNLKYIPEKDNRQKGAG